MSPALFEALLERKPVANIVASECSGAEMCDAARGWAESIAAVFEDDPTSWSAGWLVAHCQLVSGDVDDAAVLLDGLPSDIDHLPVLIDRARLAIERSQAKEARRLLTAAERLADDLPRMALLSFGYRQLIGELNEEVEVWADNQPRPMASKRTLPVRIGPQVQGVSPGARAAPDRRPLTLALPQDGPFRSGAGRGIDRLARLGDDRCHGRAPSLGGDG